MQVTHSTPGRIVRNGQVYHELEVTTVETIEIPVPDTSHLITEDETPVDTIFSEQQQRLLVDVLRSSADDWNPNKIPFLAMANVGIVASLTSPAIWLRWCDERGKVFATGSERVTIEKQRAEAEKQRAETKKQRAEAERQRADSLDTALSAERDRAERLAERLRALGISLDEI
jgi:hypothetical protein